MNAIIKTKTKNRIAAWIIWAMQWIFMAAACVSFYIFFTKADNAGIFGGVFFMIFSFQAHKLRIQFFREYTGIEKSVDFFKWLGKQNRATRRKYAQNIARIGQKQANKQR